MYTKPVTPYPAVMPSPEIMNVQDFRKTFAARAEQAVEEATPTAVTRYGKPYVILVSMDWYRRAAEALGTPTDL